MSVTRGVVVHDEFVVHQLEDSESLEWPGDDDHTFVLLPGNPGLARYYRRFGEQIAARTDARVLAIGWRGFGSTAAAATTTSLESQIAHARASLPPGDVALVGHSIGALVALELLKSPPPATRIKGAVAVMPFLSANPENALYKAKSAAATTLARFPLLIRTVLLFLRMLPVAVRGLVLGWCGQPTAHMSSEARAVTLDLMTRPRNVLAMLRMGASEFASPRISSPSIPDNKNLAFVYASEADPWVSDATRAAVREAGVPTATIKASHDFCTSDVASDSAAAAVAKLAAAFS